MFCSIGFKTLLKRTTVKNFREYKSVSKPFVTNINGDYTLTRILSNTTGATCGAGVAFRSVGPELILCNRNILNQHRAYNCFLIAIETRFWSTIYFIFSAITKPLNHA